jgi:hypothetical protein
MTIVLLAVVWLTATATHSMRGSPDITRHPRTPIGRGAVAFVDRTAGLGRVGSAAGRNRQGVSSSNAARTRSWTGSSAVIS